MLERLRGLTGRKASANRNSVSDGSSQEKSPTKTQVAFLSLFRILNDSDSLMCDALNATTSYDRLALSLANSVDSQ